MSLPAIRFTAPVTALALLALVFSLLTVAPTVAEAAPADAAEAPIADADEAPVYVDAVRPNDRQWSKQWGKRRVNAHEAWVRTKGRASTIVAVLDSGVDPNHPDLSGALVRGTNTIDGNTNTRDDHGHGTKVAGIVAARSDNIRGVASVCWRCSIMPIKVIRRDGSGTTGALARGIRWATDHGAKVIVMSLSGPSGSDSLLSAVRYAHSKGVIMVSSAGNTGTKARRYPAAYSQVIGVAATNSNDSRRSTSAYGQWVSVAAPGCNMTTTRGGGYAEFCGTSSAAPIVAGIAGLARSYRPDARYSYIRRSVLRGTTSLGYVYYGRADARRTLNKLRALTS